MAEPQWLDDDQARAWRGFLRMHQLLRMALERELVADTGLSLADYGVLVALSEADGHRLRMSVLAEELHWSRSRLSHQLARMHDRELVCRQDCLTDARGAFAVLTLEGLAAIEAAAAGHLAGVRRHLLDRLTPQQVLALGDIANAVTAPLAARCETVAQEDCGSPRPLPPS